MRKNMKKAAKLTYSSWPYGRTRFGSTQVGDLVNVSALRARLEKVRKVRVARLPRELAEVDARPAVLAAMLEILAAGARAYLRKKPDGYVLYAVRAS